MRRADIVAETRSWLGTPYRHQASVKGVGADCLGLVRGVWRACVGPEPEAPPPYRPDWAEIDPRETLVQGARRWLEPRTGGEPQAGDVLLFRMNAEACVKHCAILSDPVNGRIVHAYWGRAVVESWLSPWWRRRVAHAFAFPDLED